MRPGNEEPTGLGVPRLMLRPFCVGPRSDSPGICTVMRLQPLFPRSAQTDSPTDAREETQTSESCETRHHHSQTTDTIITTRY